jgi:RNA-directed DNA polymerase
MPIFPLYSGPALLEQATSVENLTTAWRRVRANIHTARRGKSAGIDAVTLRDFEAGAYGHDPQGQWRRTGHRHPQHS